MVAGRPNDQSRIALDELLGINPTTLASRLRALKLTPPKPR